jgi:uncharacterized membrane protein
MRRGFDLYLLLTILFSIPLMGPLFMPGYFWNAHDARHNVFFILELDRSIKDGILYPRWSPDFAFGYGYPFFNIYGPFPSYLGEIFHLLGFDIPTSVKIVFGLSILASGLAMFLFLRRMVGSGAAFLGAMVYLYAPYHIFDFYVRAALAEAVSLAFIPLVSGGLRECGKAAVERFSRHSLRLCIAHGHQQLGSLSCYSDFSRLPSPSGRFESLRRTTSGEVLASVLSDGLREFLHAALPLPSVYFWGLR